MKSANLFTELIWQKKTQTSNSPKPHRQGVNNSEIKYYYLLYHCSEKTDTHNAYGISSEHCNWKCISKTFAFIRFTKLINNQAMKNFTINREVLQATLLHQSKELKASSSSFTFAVSQQKIKWGKNQQNHLCAALYLKQLELRDKN